MKRYRIFRMDFDTRAHLLESAPASWDATVKDAHEIERTRHLEGMKCQFGVWNLEQKIKNFIDLKTKPVSVLSFHNRFLEQCRNAFVIGSYYPALTAACALGERLLNHLIIGLRENYRDTKEYKRIYRKESFDHWPLAIETLQAWKVLLPESVALFTQLNEKRNRAIHFNPEIDRNDRALALDAIHLLQEIVSAQFSILGTSLFTSKPWIFVVTGEFYLRQEWINDPFVRLVYLPSCGLVGPKHIVVAVNPWKIEDNFEYEDRVITDDEFSTLRKEKHIASLPPTRTRP